MATHNAIVHKDPVARQVLKKTYPGGRVYWKVVKTSHLAEFITGRVVP